MFPLNLQAVIISVVTEPQHQQQHKRGTGPANYLSRLQWDQPRQLPVRSAVGMDTTTLYVYAMFVQGWSRCRLDV